MERLVVPELVAVERRDRRLGAVLRAHVNEGVTARAAARSIHNNARCCHLHKHNSNRIT